MACSCRDRLAEVAMTTLFPSSDNTTRFKLHVNDLEMKSSSSKKMYLLHFKPGIPNENWIVKNESVYPCTQF
jgi:hypothetical protein